MATILVNKFFHEMNGSADVSLEPLNEIYFNKHPMLRTVEKIFAQWQTVARTQGYSAFKKTVVSGTALKKILIDLFGLDLETFIISSSFTEVNMAVYQRRPSHELNSQGQQLRKEFNDYYDANHNKLLKIDDTTDTSSEEFKKASIEFTNHMNAYEDTMNNKNWKKFRYMVTKDGVDPKFFVCKNSKKDSLTFPVLHPTCTIKFYYKMFIEREITPRMITACLLHEIGHVFAKYLLPPVMYLDWFADDEEKTFQIHNLDRYSDEKFADQFAAMYGYGQDYIKLEMYFQNIPKTKKTIDEKGYDNSLHTELSDYSEHPPYKSRINNVINQMKSDLKDLDPDDPKLESLKAILKQSRKYMRNFRKDHYIVNRYMDEMSNKKIKHNDKIERYGRKIVAPRNVNDIIDDTV